MRTDKEMDLLLREALAPRLTPEKEMQKALLEATLREWDRQARPECDPAGSPEQPGQTNEFGRSKDRKVIAMKKRKVASVAAAAAICVLAVSATAAAAVKYLSREEIVQEMNETQAEKAFEDGEVLEVNQTQEAGDYRFRLYAVATKEQLAESGLDSENADGGNLEEGGTYAVVSIERLDGTPMPATSSDEYGDLEFFVSPLIQGLTPWQYNIASMGGSYGDMVKDGILYRVIRCDDIALFADRDLYLCITDTTFYRTEAFTFQEDGTIVRNEDYDGVNVLFDLPIDASRADQEKADAYLERLEREWSSDSSEEGENGEGASEENSYSRLMGAVLAAEQAKGADVTDIQDISDETLLGYAVLEEDSVQILPIGEDGMVNYSYGTSEMSFQPEWYFEEENRVIGGMSAVSEDKLSLNVFVKEADGTIKGMQYVLTEESIAANTTSADSNTP